MNMLRSALLFIHDIREARRVIPQLARQDFRNRYLGSSLGFIWTIIQPLVMVLLLWSVFTIAFKAPDVDGTPFGFYLLAGIAAWNFFSESLVMATNVFHEYSFMVKKVYFRIAVLPIVKILSCLVVHIIFLVVVAVLLLAGGRKFSLWWFQIAYYAFALLALQSGLCLITSSINVFTRDMVQMVNIFLQFGFWVTPIVWHAGMIPEQFHWIIKLNPLFYIVEGYRRSFLYEIPFWRDPVWTIYFWGITVIVLLIGIAVFKKLKPHFADVL